MGRKAFQADSRIHVPITGINAQKKMLCVFVSFFCCNIISIFVSVQQLLEIKLEQRLSLISTQDLQ